MYPKTTFLKREMDSSDNYSFKKQQYKSKDMKESHLKLHNEPERSYQYFEIDMPYLILYENFNMVANRAIYLEFSEDNKIFASKTFGTYDEQEQRLHSHDFYELTFVLSGQLHMKIENEDLVYYPGECCICNKNIHHMELMDTKTEIVLLLLKEEYIKAVFDTNFYYDNKGNPHVAETFFNTFIIQNQKNPFYDAKTYIDFRLINNASPEIFFKTINDMIENISENHSGKSHMMKALICRFIEMIEDEDMHKPEIHWAKLSTEEQIVYNISQAYRDKSGIFTRSEIEQITGYNSDYVERIIKRNTGKTLSGYGKSILLQKAAILLSETDKSIGSICEEMGYSNRNYFNKIFIKQYGVTPSQYRAQKKEKAAHH